MDPFTGEIRIFGFNFAPCDWAMCDGQLLAVVQFQALFSIISNYYGGDGRVSFAVPNFTGGRSPLHVGGVSGRGPGLAYHQLGEGGGANGVTLRTSEIPSHTHTAKADLTKGATGVPPQNNFLARSNKVSPGGTNAYSDDLSNLTQMASNALEPLGGNVAHENRQPFLALNFCICLDGIYPPRN